MNPHDHNAPPRADFMLARLFATLLFGVIMLVIGFLLGEYRGAFKVCIEVPKKVQTLPQTKAEKAAFVQYYSNRGM